VSCVAIEDIKTLPAPSIKQLCLSFLNSLYREVHTLLCLCSFFGTNYCPDKTICFCNFFKWCPHVKTWCSTPWFAKLLFLSLFVMSICFCVVHSIKGNVALDVARILLRCTTELASTDIAGYALDALRSSTIRYPYLFIWTLSFVCELLWMLGW
jgi:hypothetical protein